MKLVNVADIQTASGYKSIELHLGDLSDPAFNVDLLIFSAFRGDYYPAPRTLIWHLQETRNINVSELYKSAAIDLQGSMGVWLSEELTGQPYKRIACVEIVSYHNKGSLAAIEQAVTNLFSLIAMANILGITIGSIAMPLIGSGLQRIDPENILPVLMKLSENTLKNFSFLQKIIFVERTPEKINALDKAMNSYLNRTPADTQGMPDTDISNAIADDLLANLAKLKGQLGVSHSVTETVNELEAKLKQKNIRFFELGILSRRLTEALTRDVLETTVEGLSLYKLIEALRGKNIAGWIISYLHILRTFGNEAAHHKDTQNIPESVSDSDLMTIMFCLNRAVDFWAWYRHKRSTNLFT